MQNVWASEKDKLLSQLRDEARAKYSKPEKSQSHGLFWLLAKLAAFILLIWPIAYTTGLFPYLGQMEFKRRFAESAVPIEDEWITVNPPAAYLVKGQTIFIDYKAKVGGKDYVRILLAEWGRHETEPTWHWGSAYINHDREGRYIYTVPHSGFYSVWASTRGIYARNATSYLITWGAIFGGDVNKLPKSSFTPEQMPQQ